MRAPRYRWHCQSPPRQRPERWQSFRRSSAYARFECLLGTNGDRRQGVEGSKRFPERDLMSEPTVNYSGSSRFEHVQRIAALERRGLELQAQFARTAPGVIQFGG